MDYYDGDAALLGWDWAPDPFPCPPADPDTSLSLAASAEVEVELVAKARARRRKPLRKHKPPAWLIRQQKRKRPPRQVYVPARTAPMLPDPPARPGRYVIGTTGRLRFLHGPGEEATFISTPQAEHS